MKKTYHIIVVESSAMLSEGVCALLFKTGLNCVITVVNSMDELLSSHKNRKCHIAIVNPSFIQNNPKLLSIAKMQCENTHWMALVYTYVDEFVLSQFEDSITISDTPESILFKINKLQNQLEDNSVQQPNALSDREMDVLKLLTSGNSNKEIADRLHISVNTVITHRKNISQKTGIKTVSGLTIYAVLQKIINPENISG